MTDAEHSPNDKLREEAMLASKIIMDVVDIIPTSAFAVVIALLTSSLGMSYGLLLKVPKDKRREVAEIMMMYYQLAFKKLTAVAEGEDDVINGVDSLIRPKGAD